MTTQDPKSCCSWLIWAVDHGRNMMYIYNIMIYPKSVNSTGQNFLKWNCWVLQLLWLGYPIGLLGCMFFSIIANAKKTQDHVLAGMMINRLIFTKIWSREKSREIERSRERVLCRTLKVHSETLKVHSETLKVNSAAIENREKSREIERNREEWFSNPYLNITFWKYSDGPLSTQHALLRDDVLRFFYCAWVAYLQPDWYGKAKCPGAKASPVSLDAKIREENQ